MTTTAPLSSPAVTVMLIFSPGVAVPQIGQNGWSRCTTALSAKRGCGVISARATLAQIVASPMTRNNRRESIGRLRRGKMCMQQVGDRLNATAAGGNRRDVVFG